MHKHRKYDVSFRGHPFLFTAVVFETLGAINVEGELALKQIFRFAAKRTGREFSSYCGRAWARFSCVLQRAVSQAILTRTSGQPGPQSEEFTTTTPDPAPESEGENNRKYPRDENPVLVTIARNPTPRDPPFRCGPHPPVRGAPGPPHEPFRCDPDPPRDCYPGYALNTPEALDPSAHPQPHRTGLYPNPLGHGHPGPRRWRLLLPLGWGHRRPARLSHQRGHTVFQARPRRSAEPNLEELHVLEGTHR